MKNVEKKTGRTSRFKITRNPAKAGVRCFDKCAILICDEKGNFKSMTSKNFSCFSTERGW